MHRDQRGLAAVAGTAADSSISRSCQSGSRLAAGSSSSSSLRPRRQRAGDQHAAALAGRQPVDPAAGDGSELERQPSPRSAPPRRRPARSDRARRAARRCRGRPAGRRAAAAPLGRASAARIDAVDPHLARRPRRCRPGRGAGWSCRCRWGRPGRPARRAPARSRRLAAARRAPAARPRAERHRASLQRICATSQRKKGAPSKAVTTPIGSVRPSGAAAHDEVGGEQQQRADQRRREDRPAGMAAGQPPREDRRDQADEADRPADRDAGADAERGQADDLRAAAADVVAERLRHLLAERQAVERRARAAAAAGSSASAGTAAKAAWARLRSTSEPISQS